jgi:hypothetical protein
MEGEGSLSLDKSGDAFKESSTGVAAVEIPPKKCQ